MMRPKPPKPRVPLAEAAAAVIPLLNMADDAPDADVSAAVAKVMTAMGAGLRLDALSRSTGAAQPQPHRLAPGLGPLGLRTRGRGLRPCLRRDGHMPSPSLRAMVIFCGFMSRGRLPLWRPSRTGPEDFPTSAQLRQASLDGAGSDPRSDLPAHLRADLRDGLAALARAIEKVVDGDSAPKSVHHEPMMQATARTA